MNPSNTNNSTLTRSVPFRFFNLPSGIRNRIYHELLVLQHPIYIFQEPNSALESFAPGRRIHWLALLHTNRRTHQESSAVVYGENKFNVTDTSGREASILQSFLSCIGAPNVATLSHLCIEFPAAEHMVSTVDHNSSSSSNSRQSLQTTTLLRTRCPKLLTLELIVHHRNSSVFRGPQGALETGLESTKARLKAFPSLRKIVVRFADFDGIPTAASVESMQGLGWCVVAPNGTFMQ